MRTLGTFSPSQGRMTSSLGEGPLLFHFEYIHILLEVVIEDYFLREFERKRGNVASCMEHLARREEKWHPTSFCPLFYC